MSSTDKLKTVSCDEEILLPSADDGLHNETETDTNQPIANLTPAVAVTGDGTNTPSDEIKQTDNSEVLKDQLCDEKSKSSVSSDFDDDIVLKWDDDDEEKDKSTLDEGEIDENELLKDIEDEITKLSSNEELLDNNLISSPTEKQSLKDPNAMLEIPTQEIIEFSDDEELTDSWKIMPDDDLDDEIIDKDTVSTTDEPTSDNIKEKKEIDVEPKIKETGPKNDSESISIKDNAANLGDLILESLDDEEKKIDKESVNMVSLTVDSETEADDVIDLDDHTELEDAPTPTAIEEPKPITEEEELQNAISGIEQSMKESDIYTTNIDKIIQEIEPAQNDDHDDPEQDASVADEYKTPDTMETELIKKTESEQSCVDENIEADVVASEQDLKEIDILPLNSVEDTKIIKEEEQISQIDTITEDKEMHVVPTDSVVVSKNLHVNDELFTNESLITAKQDEINKPTPIEEVKPDELEVIASEVLKNTKCSQQDLRKDEKVNNNSNSDSVKQNLGTSIPDKDIEKTSSNIECLPSTSKDYVAKSENTEDPGTSKSVVEECLPSTSKHDPSIQSDTDGLNNVQDTSDSLGLLAESSRVIDDDEDGDDDDDGDDEDEFDPDDESSNQMTAEQSEDSNARYESDGQKDTPQEEKSHKEEDTFPLHKEIEGESVEKAPDTAQSDETDKNQPDGIKMDVPDQENADMEIFKLSDTDTDDGDIKTKTESKTDEETAKEESATNFVDLEGSSSEDDTPEQNNQTDIQNVTSVNIPANIDVMSSTCSSNPCSVAIVNKEGDVVISGIPKMPPARPARLDTSEVSIKTTKTPSLEVFNLDSDDEEPKGLEDQGKSEHECIDKQNVAQEAEELADEVTDCARKKKCVNESCPNYSRVYYVADNSTVSFYEGKKNRYYVCSTCADVVAARNAKLIEGIRNFEDLLTLDLGKDCKDPIEVLDSDSDEDVDPEDVEKDLVGEEGAKLLEEQLADMINATWDKFKMDTRLLDTVDALKKQMADLESEGMQVDAMLKECQASTDKLRNELYATFQPEIQELPALCIVDTLNTSYTSLEASPNQSETRNLKRRMSPSNNTSSKRAAIPLRYTPLTGDTQGQRVSACYDDASADKFEDDNTDIAVVKLSAEVAPADLPPPGNIVRAALRPGMDVFAKRKELRSWGKAVIVEVGGASVTEYTNCRVKFEASPRNLYKNLTAQCLAYFEPAKARLTIGTRVIALYEDTNQKRQLQKKNDSFYAGVVAEIPNPVNNYRYLIFFDHGYAQYAKHKNTRLVCECSSFVWEEVYSASKDFVRKYLMEYPERPMVRLHAGQSIRIEWRGKWCPAKVLKVDASLVLVQFGKDLQERVEWIYRGSNRLEPLFLEQQAAERHRPRALPRAQAHSRTNIPYVEYTRSEEQMKSNESASQKDVVNEDIRRQRAVAKKSTTQPSQTTPPVSSKLDNFTSRVVYYTPKNAVRPHRITGPHLCGAACARRDVLALRDLRTYNPLAKPLLSGWERQIVRWKGNKGVMYRAPCGRRVRNMKELHKYLRTVGSDMGVDLFDFNPNTHCLAEFVINKCLISKKDLSHGKENVPVPCVNYYDESLPEFCSYNTERTPTAGVPLNLDPAFLCGCDCDDDCADKTKCACWKMTLEGARTIGLDGANVGYVYKRLPEPLPSGIYECNSRCKCKSTCLNRVAQHPLQLKLQVFKTMNRGWGIRALNDVPKGAFLCIYAGNLLTDATANLDGLNEGDEYLAELDYIEVVEQMKEGYEEDIPESIKQLDKKESDKTSDESETAESSTSEEEKSAEKDDDDEFVPAYIGSGVMKFNKRLRKRTKNNEEKEKEDTEAEKEKEKKSSDDCITISDDEDVREPSRFTAAAGMGGSEFLSKYKSVRTLFGEDEACYIMDAKVQGNIGRYLNHSCCPNVFVQNVFVDTHDPRFPWVAFFALTHIRAGRELTWNYNYDVGSVPGKVLYCHCGEPNCRGRLL
ncbi:histone-lysine N-methyltransferase eggless [Zerene cesonia]|uniref:histone-lysine N-methyltransferase eggless n=1 Tax=Zerene cesonia TaxID=33412 RepID=UPI0018E56BD0|nr:histone-lysine N-methyltransferase eggless [Zerene cesonia]